MDIKEIGRRIKKARTIRNYTLDYIASEIGVAKSTIQRYENGLIVNPKLPVLQSIADTLHVNPAWLSGQDVPMENEDSAESIINHRLSEINMSLQELADKAEVPLHWLENISTFIPGAFGGYEIGYTWITSVAEVLGLPGSVLRSALAKQEIPEPDLEECPRISAKEAFGYDTGTSNEKMYPVILEAQDKSRSLQRMFSYYTALNKSGKDKVVTYAKNLLANQQLEEELNAAHERADATAEEKAISDAIMMDDDEWK